MQFPTFNTQRLASFMDTRTKLTIFKSFIASNFSYCCHIWYFCSPTLKTRLEKIQYRGLRYVYNDYNSSYEVLLARSGMCSIDLLVQKTIVVEIYKSLHGIGATYLSDLFSFGKICTRSNSKNLVVPRVDSTLYGLHSIRYHGTKLWAALPENAKSATDLASFKGSLETFKGITCKCSYCKSSRAIHGSSTS